MHHVDTTTSINQVCVAKTSLLGLSEPGPLEMRDIAYKAPTTIWRVQRHLPTTIKATTTKVVILAIHEA
jgi:hypothetical protein